MCTLELGRLRIRRLDRQPKRSLAGYSFFAAVHSKGSLEASCSARFLLGVDGLGIPHKALPEGLTRPSSRPARQLLCRTQSPCRVQLPRRSSTMHEPTIVQLSSCRGAPLLDGSQMLGPDAAAAV